MFVRRCSAFSLCHGSWLLDLWSIAVFYAKSTPTTAGEENLFTFMFNSE